MINKNSKIYISGHNGMVGSACYNVFYKNGYKNILTKSSSELDLRNQKKVDVFLKNEKPELIICASAKVGGIHANNKFPFEFLNDNILIQSNLINSAYNNNVNKFIFLGSSCIYPKNADQPIKEEYLLSGQLEKTNQWYAIAKITGLKMIESLRLEYNKEYVSLMPTNLYGDNDNYDLKTSHVLPALIRKIHEAKINKLDSVELWGNGEPLREFMHVTDLAEAIFFIANYRKKLDYPFYNVGSGEEITIKNLATLISKIIGFNGYFNFNLEYPNGTMRKKIDSSRINNLGWKSNIKLEDGIINTYKNFIKNYDKR